MANLIIDRCKSYVSFQGGVLDVNEVEFEILWTLANKPGRVFTADDLQQLMTPSHSFQRGKVRVAMESLAAKLSHWVYFDQNTGFQFRRA